jgi:tetratricopeptide (TPR) repeat protein
VTRNTERTGVHSVGVRVEDGLNWLFRELPVNDFGVDAHIEQCIADRPTGKLIGVQIKSGESYFREADSESVVFRHSLRHLEYWLNYSVPVVIVLVHPERQEYIWELVSTATATRLDAGGRIRIPRQQRFDASAIPKFEEILANATTLASLKELEHRAAEEHFQHGQRLSAESLYDEALIAFSAAVQLNPRMPEAFNNRGAVKNALGDQNGALADFDMAIALEPDGSEAHRNRGDVLQELGRLQEALDSYTRSRGRIPRREQGW